MIFFTILLDHLPMAKYLGKCSFEYFKFRPDIEIRAFLRLVLPSTATKQSHAGFDSRLAQELCVT